MILTVRLHSTIRKRTGRCLRVLVDCRDVTHRCVSASDRQGWALCFVKGADGRCLVRPDRRGPLMELLVGQVIFDGTAPCCMGADRQ